MTAVSREALDPAAVALRAAAVQSVALVLVNAAQHLQRTTVLVEAATTASLARALDPEAGSGETGAEALEISRRSMAEAVDAYRQALDVAMGLSQTIAP
ncbi:hypothetical protein [Caulobacter soli]|uniref:hypothetical protein n=1 Tax=Caulobacter soli TaxID=2708539 RepID=UPI0013EB88A9|nr:hypothetical protein [Caulobacter soli]